MADYPGVLADLRGRIALIDQERKELEIAIAAIERISGAYGANSAGTQRLLLPTIESTATVGGSNGSFRGMRMPEAIYKHFLAAREPQTVRQIVEALRAGGFEGNQNLRGHVYNTLHRLQAPNGPYIHGENGQWIFRPASAAAPIPIAR